VTEIKKIYSEAEMDAFYEKAEMDQLRAALKRTYKERFQMMTTLMKMDLLFRRAKITHKPFLETDK
jgi:hypothetical protein